MLGQVGVVISPTLHLDLSAKEFLRISILLDYALP